MFKLSSGDSTLTMEVVEQSFYPASPGESASLLSLKLVFRVQAYGIEAWLPSWFHLSTLERVLEEGRAFLRRETPTAELRGETLEKMRLEFGRLGDGEPSLALELRPRDSIEDPFTNLVRVYFRPSEGDIEELLRWLAKHADGEYANALASAALDEEAIEEWWLFRSSGRL